MKITPTKLLLVLTAVVIYMGTTAPAFADHATADVQIPTGTAIPGCEVAKGCYTPYEVTVDVGGEVTWNNEDNTFHTVTAGVGLADPQGVAGDFPAGSGMDYPDGFDSSIIQAGESFSQKFETAGTYPYYCTLHVWMTGIVNVEHAHPPPGNNPDKKDGKTTPRPESIDEVMATIRTGDAVHGRPLLIDVKVTDTDGGVLEHVNFKVVAMYNGRVIHESVEHAHDGKASVMTGPLNVVPSSQMPIHITVELVGFGVGEITGPAGTLPQSAQTIPIRTTAPPTDADTTPPKILRPSDLTTDAKDGAGARVVFDILVIDETDGVITNVSCTRQSGSIFPVGTTTVTCNASDRAGNAAQPVSFAVTVNTSEAPIPDWIKNVAAFWCDGKIDDSAFVEGVQYLVDNGIIKTKEGTRPGVDSGLHVPSWVKNNACWWSAGVTSDKEFTSALEFLINKGIVKAGSGR